MKTYIEIVLKRPKTIILALLLITLGMGTGVPKLLFDNSPDVMMPKQDKRYIFNEDVKKIYGNVGNFIIISVTADDIWQTGFFKALDNLITDIEEYQYCDEEKETGRLARIDKLRLQDKISPEKLIASFDDDPPFQRDLKRRIQKYFGDISQLDTRKLSYLQKELTRVFTIKQHQSIESILSPLTASNMSGKNDTLQKEDLIPKDDNNKRLLPKTVVDLQEFRNRLKKNPAFYKTLYAADSETGMITDFAVMAKVDNSKSGQDLTNEVCDIAASYKSLSPSISGVPVINKVLNDYMQKDLSRFLPLIFLAIVIIFFFNFGSARGVCLPFIALIMADVWTLGLMGHLGIKMTLIGVSLPALMVAIGSSYSIHILNQYYTDFQTITRLGKKTGLRGSMKHISVTVMLAGLTTCIGFFSILANQVVAIREWGVFSAIGVLFAMIISTSLIPAGLMLMPHKQSFLNNKFFQASAKNWVDTIIKLFITASTRYHKTVLSAAGVILTVSIIGIFNMQVDTAILGYFKENTPFRKNTISIGEKFGGSFGMSILIDSGKTNGIYNPSFLKKVDEIRDWMTSKENHDLHISKTMAFTDILKNMHMAMNNDNPEFYAVPPTRSEVMDYLEIYEGEDDNSDGRIDDLEPFIDEDFRILLLFAKLSDDHSRLITTQKMIKTKKKVTQYLNHTLPSPYTYKITGESDIFIALSEYVIKGQMMSLVFCLCAVCTIITLLFKNMKAGLISLIPISFAVIMNFGIMGWFHINLDTATAIIASITIGIGVDDTIHFLNTYRFFKAQGLQTDDAIIKTLSISGKAIIYTSVALIFGYSVLMVSNFKPLIFFGLLTMITMVATTIGALAILPATIKGTEVSLEANQSDSWFWQLFDIGKFFNFEEELMN